MQMNPFSSRAFWCAALITAVFAYLGVWFYDWSRKDIFPIYDLIQSSSAIAGTESHNEREFKVRIDKFSIRQLPLIQKTIKESLNEVLVPGALTVPKLIDRPYEVRDDEVPYVFLDFYFDSENLDLNRANLAYRLRYRWKSAPDFVRFINGGRNSEDLPIRCEIQCKLQRTEGEFGFSETVESRFEFRDESEPFSSLYPAPTSPWPFVDFIQIARRGTYEGVVMKPSRECARVLFDKTGARNLNIFPQFAVLDIRTRHHLLIKTPWGSGPMPDDAFIITLDHFWYTDQLGWIARLDYGRVLSIHKLFYEAGAEMEFEFERNVAAGLKKSQRDVSSKPAIDLHTVENAFLADLTIVKNKVMKDLENRGISSQAVNVSKFKQILEKINAARTQ